MGIHGSPSPCGHLERYRSPVERHHARGGKPVAHPIHLVGHHTHALLYNPGHAVHDVGHLPFTLGFISSIVSMDCCMLNIVFRISSISPSISGAISATGLAVLSSLVIALDISPKFLKPSVHSGCHTITTK